MVCCALVYQTTVAKPKAKFGALKLMKLKSKLPQLVPIPHHQSKRRKATKRKLAPRGVLNREFKMGHYGYPVRLDENWGSGSRCNAHDQFSFVHPHRQCRPQGPRAFTVSGIEMPRTLG